jgi:hypothetical protein
LRLMPPHVRRQAMFSRFAFGKMPFGGAGV